MMKILISWIGATDFQSSRGESLRPPGPIARTLQDARYTDLDEIRLLNNYAKEKTSDFKKWLVKETKTKASINIRSVKDLPSPTDFEEIILTRFDYSDLQDRYYIIESFDSIIEDLNNKKDLFYYQGVPN